MSALHPDLSWLEHEPHLLSRERAAELVSSHLRTIDRRIADGTFVTVRAGGRVLITRASFARWLQVENP